MKIKNTFKVIKGFFKRNVYALTVAFSVLAVFSVITALSVADLYKKKETSEPIQTIEQNESNEQVVPTETNSVIVFESPVKDAVVCKDYCDDCLVEDKTTGVWKTHQAIDYCGAEGTDVYAVYDGKVIKVEKDVMNGTVVEIEHSEGLVSVYKSLGSALVSVGQDVKTGDTIGKMGVATNEKADGSHLHFEVKLDGKLVNPNNYLGEAGK
ncbi:MAG: M23 family metallopeptidase [bacterium]|nr:M23 family metallopeptidase [bacterium]